MQAYKFYFLNFLITNSRLDYIFSQFAFWVDHTFTAHFFYIFLKYVAIPFLIFIITYFVSILVVKRYYFDKLKSKKKSVETEINDFLTSLIFSNYSYHEIKLKIEEFKKTEVFQNKWCKYLILDKLIHIKRNIKAVNQNLILIIYKQFGLHKYSQKLINRKKWYYKSLGFYHYQSLDYKIKKAHIKPYLDSKNKYLKSNALIALIALSDEKFDILKNYTEKIPSADEMKILDLIYQKKSVIPKTINSWLDSNNSSVIILAIKLMVRYRENISAAKIKFLLLHQDIIVRKEVILAIRELVFFDANKILTEHYLKESDIRNKISILKTLTIIGDYSIRDFAISLLVVEKNIDIKFEIINCIIKIDRSYF
ncbi:hypothetical protein, partial [Flavobacterium sp.]|uniref:hypothetical protein n=1 Tax=Flavobacterium sp. TaxID=239 RepID=UPI003752883B